MAKPTPLHGVAALPAASIRPRQTPSRSRNLLIYWHLLSLDAPTVAMLWTWFIARSNGVTLPLTSIAAMGVAVWLLYAADRLLDARSSGASHLEPRHLFHRRHRSAFHSGIALASLTLVFLVYRITPAALQLYAILSAPLIGYFVLIHLQRKSPTVRSTPPVPRLTPRLPKEIAVGLFFSAATFIPTVARNPSLRTSLLPAAVLFGMACSLNCLFIYTWEHPIIPSAGYPEAHPATRLALQFLPWLTILSIAGSLGLACYGSLPGSSGCAPWQLTLALSLAGALLLQLHMRRYSLDPTTLRAAADLCLLTPLLLVFALHS